MTSFSPFEVNAPHLAYAFLGGFVVIFGMFSLFIKEKLYIGEAPIATVVGIIIGPHCLKLFDPYGWGGSSRETTDEITLEVTRVVIALSVFAVGVELPKAYMKRHWRTLVFLLGPCMIWGWMVSALLIWGLLPGHNFLSSLVIAACVTPTDPILAQAVIGGSFADKHVPAHIRHMLSAESGSNDGAAFPFLYIALYLLLDASPGHAVGEWFYYTIAYEVILGIILGALLGWAARKVMKFAERKKLIDRQSYVAQYVSLAILSIGISTLLGSDDLLSAFACGCAFAWDGFFNKATEDALFSNVIDLLFNCAAFIYIGAIIPFEYFNDPHLGLNAWRLTVLTILILLFRRLPVILATYRWIPDIKTFREALFTGWFGPMGVGAIFISTLARLGLPLGEAEKDTEAVDNLRETIGPIVAFLVLSSVVTHGLSIPFFSLTKRVHSITYTWSRNPSMDNRRDNEPAWTTHARRIQPGQQIRVNRDDDPEDGDLGIKRRDMNAESESRNFNEKEKLELRSEGSGSGSGSGSPSHGSSSLRAQAAREEIEMMERGGSSDDRSGSGRDSPRGEDGEKRRGSGEFQEGQRTPPLAQYREGNHLIIERRRGSGNEVEVEVLRNHFHDEKPSERGIFHHPQELKAKEVDTLHHHLETSVEHAVSRVENEGKHAIDRLGLGLIRSSSNASHPTTVESPRPSSPASRRSATPSPERRPRRRLSDESERHNESDDEPQPLRTIHIDPARLRRNQPTLRQRILGTFGIGGGASKKQNHSSPGGGSGTSGASSAERGEGLGFKPTSSRHNTQSSAPYVQEPESILYDRNNTDDAGNGSGPPSPEDRTGLSLIRSPSVQNGRIRFAAETSQSSDTAPGPGNYGNQAPGFKRTPGLSMFRTTSVQSQGEDADSGTPGASVSFAEPDRRR